MRRRDGRPEEGQDGRAAHADAGHGSELVRRRRRIDVVSVLNMNLHVNLINIDDSFDAFLYFCTRLAELSCLV